MDKELLTKFQQINNQYCSSIFQENEKTTNTRNHNSHYHETKRKCDHCTHGARAWTPSTRDVAGDGAYEDNSSDMQNS